MAFHGRNFHLDRQYKLHNPTKRAERRKKAARHQKKIADLLRRLAEQEKGRE